MTQEDKYSKVIVQLLKEKFKEKYPKLNIKNKEQILIGITCGFRKNNIKMIFQSAEQDIVIYLEDYNYNINIKENDFVSSFSKSLPHGKVLIPLIIFEVKNKSVITHAVRQYSEIARMVKSVFPFCMYNFLLLNFKDPNHEVDKIYMASKNFDRIIYEPEFNYENPEEVVNKILIIIEQHIEYLKNDKFFRLSKFLV